MRSTCPPHPLTSLHSTSGCMSCSGNSYSVVMCHMDASPNFSRVLAQQGVLQRDWTWAQNVKKWEVWSCCQAVMYFGFTPFSLHLPQPKVCEKGLNCSQRSRERWQNLPWDIIESHVLCYEGLSRRKRRKHGNSAFGGTLVSDVMSVPAFNYFLPEFSFLSFLLRSALSHGKLSVKNAKPTVWHYSVMLFFASPSTAD